MCKVDIKKCFVITEAEFSESNSVHSPTLSETLFLRKIRNHAYYEFQLGTPKSLKGICNK